APNLEASFLESVKEFTALQKDMRTDPRLRNLSRQLFPEVDAPPVPPVDPTAADSVSELAALSQMLQIMESAWLGVHLEGYAAHPLNRGWMNVFRRWANTPAF